MHHEKGKSTLTRALLYVSLIFHKPVLILVHVKANIKVIYCLHKTVHFLKNKIEITINWFICEITKIIQKIYKLL